jgi:hypothetical protein
MRGVVTLCVEVSSRRVSRRVQENHLKLENQREADRTHLLDLHQKMMHVLTMLTDIIRSKDANHKERGIWLKSIFGKLKKHSLLFRKSRLFSERKALLLKITSYFHQFFEDLISVDSSGGGSDVVVDFEAWKVVPKLECIPTTQSEMCDCPVCYDQKPRSNMISGQCGHSICSACMIDFVESNKKKNGLPKCVLCRTTFNKFVFRSPVYYNQFTRMFPEVVLRVCC